MYESSVEANELDKLNKRVDVLVEQLEILNETAMATFVQLSRVYDILAATYYEKNGKSAETLLDMHEAGYINSTAPVLKAFGEPEEKNEDEQV